MSYRGRLIFPMEAEIAQWDGPAQVAAIVQDPQFGDVRVTSATGVRQQQRKEKAPIRLPAQVEPGPTDRQRQRQAGDGPETFLTLVFHFADLEDASLVDATTGVALIRPRDRLVAIRDGAGTLLEHLFRGKVGGLYCTEASPGNAWLGQRRNLLLTYWSDREQGYGS